MCERLCGTGFGRITGHRVAFKPAAPLLNPDLPLAAQVLDAAAALDEMRDAAWFVGLAPRRTRHAYLHIAPTLTSCLPSHHTQTVATSSFVKAPEETFDSADETRRAFKYHQVLESGLVGANSLWYDFAFGGWKIGVGYEVRR